MIEKNFLEDTELELLKTEVKRLRIIADMAAATIIDLEQNVIIQHTHLVAKCISVQKFNDVERRCKNLKTALKFAGYTDKYPDYKYPVKECKPTMKK